MGNDDSDWVVVVHITLLLIEGLYKEAKQAYDKAIYDVVKSHLEAMLQYTLILKVHDMNKETYVI